MSRQDPFSYGVWLLRYGSKSRGGMKAALLKKGFSAPEADGTVAKLADLGYLDDRRYAEELIRRRKTNNVRGKGWVLRTLREEGIFLADFDALYSDEEERRIIGALLEKWSRGHEISDKERQRFYGRLQSRGFNRENIFQCFDSCRGEGADGDSDFSEYP